MRLHLLAVLAAAGVATGALPARAAAQAPTLSSLAPGTRLRLTVTDSLREQPLGPRRQRVVATLVRVTPDTLVVQPLGSTSPVNYARSGVLQRIEASRGDGEGRSILVQMVVNTIVFGAAGYLFSEPADRRWALGSLAATGAVFGFVIGAVTPYEHWRRVAP